MKNLFFTLLAGMLILFSSCQKEDFSQDHRSEDVFLKIKRFEINSGIQTGITLERVDSCLKVASERTDSECFTTSDLTGDLLPNFGKVYPDILPVTNGYTQEGNFCFTARITCFGYERNPDGTTSWLGNSFQWDSTQWIIQNELAGTGPFLQFQTYNIPCDGYQPSCNGNHFLTLRAWKDGVEYVNSGEIFVLVNNAPVPTCITSPQIPLWYDPDGEIVFFPDPYPCIVPETAKGDFNGDFTVNTADLVILLSNLCEG